MIVGLDNLKEEIKRKQLRDLAYNIVKYQKFKTNIGVEKINYNASKSTIRNYFGLGVAYINCGKKHKAIPSSLYEFIDEAIAQHIQPLTPSKEDERCDYKPRTINYTKKNSVPPVAKLDIVKKPITEKYDNYGVQSPEGYVKICKSKDYAEGYIEGMKNSNKIVDGYKIVLINIGEV